MCIVWGYRPLRRTSVMNRGWGTDRYADFSYVQCLGVHAVMWDFSYVQGLGVQTAMRDLSFMNMEILPMTRSNMAGHVFAVRIECLENGYCCLFTAANRKT